MTLDGELQARVLAWIDDDPDADDRAELQALIDAGETAELSARFAGELEFGTAGLRGALGAGPMRMNRAVVARATAGFCKALLDAVPDAAERGIAIGFDGRHGSRAFAEETAAVAAGAGIRVHVFERVVPTPVLAHAVLDTGAAGGVMVTASHNPKTDNGYKVYWHNGAQIIPPVDGTIAAAMDAVPSIRDLPRLDAEARRAKDLQRDLGDAQERRYLDGVRSLYEPPQHTDVCVAYTAMHGVGQRFVVAALNEAGFGNLHCVPEQGEPNPDFPTAAFPNPEEQGAMDLVLALGRERGADLVLANDPDADRLAAAAPDASGALKAFTGNELGALLADDLLARDGGEGTMVLNSIVSSPLAARIAAAHGAYHEDTLTGFKWIGNRAMELEQERGLRFVFGFEEALGYTPGALVRDKDGVSAAVMAARVAADAKAAGQTLHDRLAAIFEQHGVYLSGQVSLRLGGADPGAEREALMTRVRETPPAAVAGLAIESTRDLLDDDDPLPKHDAVFMLLAGGSRLAVRPSGTEPKVKIYLDVCEPVGDDGVAAARTRAEATLRALEQAARAWLVPN